MFLTVFALVEVELPPKPESVAKRVSKHMHHLKKYNIPTPALVLLLDLVPRLALTAVLVSGRLTIGGSLLAPCESEQSVVKWVSKHIHLRNTTYQLQA